MLSAMQSLLLPTDPTSSVLIMAHANLNTVSAQMMMNFWER